MVAVAEGVLEKPTVVINDLPKLCPLTAKRKDSSKCCIYSLSILSYEICRKLYIISWVLLFSSTAGISLFGSLEQKVWMVHVIDLCLLVAWLRGAMGGGVGWARIAPLPLRENIYKRK